MDGDAYDPQTGEVVGYQPPRQQVPAMPDSRPQNLIFASANPGEVFGALCAMQGTMPSPKRTKPAKVEGRSRSGKEYSYTYHYAPLEEIIACIQKPMADAGLAYRQFLAVRDGQWVMRTIIAHKSGEWFGCDYPIFWDESRGMQGFASGVTYARRYGLMLALGIAAEDDDDANVADGNIAKIANAPQSRSSGSGAQEAPRGGTTTPQPANRAQRPPQTPAEAPSDVKATAIRLHREMIDSIMLLDSATDLDKIEETEQWKEVDDAISKADTPDIAANVMGKLRQRIADRKAMLLGGMG